MLRFSLKYEATSCYLLLRRNLKLFKFALLWNPVPRHLRDFVSTHAFLHSLESVLRVLCVNEIGCHNSQHNKFTSTRHVRSRRMNLVVACGMRQPWGHQPWGHVSCIRAEFYFDYFSYMMLHASYEAYVIKTVIMLHLFVFLCVWLKTNPQHNSWMIDVPQLCSPKVPTRRLQSPVTTLHRDWLKYGWKVSEVKVIESLFIPNKHG